MKRVLYLIRRCCGGVPANETIDLALISGVFEQGTSVLFMDDGVYQLKGLAKRQSALKALPTYDVRALYAAEHSLAERRMHIDDVDLPVQAVDKDVVRGLLADHDVVITD